MELVLNELFKALPITYDVLVIKLNEYTKNYKFQTFKGFLLYAGFNNTRLKNLKENERLKDRRKIIDLLEWYQSSLEVKMEEILLYQKEKVGEGYYNYKNIEWLLKKSNPKHYGDKIINISDGREEKEKEIVYKNISGFKLND